MNRLYSFTVFQLSREVRFAVNAIDDNQLSSAPSNSFGGYPSLTGAGQVLSVRVTLAGNPDPQTSYLLNIKDIDDTVRRRLIPLVAERFRTGKFGGGGNVMRELFELLRSGWPNTTLQVLRMNLSPFLSLETRAPEHPMIRLSQRFEFCASHRLHNPALSADGNRSAFGKCNSPHGHGHNYELQATLIGEPDANGLLINVPDFERIVAATVIDRFDHRNLNVEVPEFRDLNPSVEHIAMVIFRLLKPKLRLASGRLAAVTVWETPKTSCEYSE